MTAIGLIFALAAVAILLAIRLLFDGDDDGPDHQGLVK